ncbi:RagB/SusD family nutrient uptake outer membrane protein [Flavobacterium sp. 11]|uniref:RagB/SusD family nutrient uptake outer membrane protein n=1 Tax=Flavobacterium sp. 11 TaxID=357523 RepID=UPI000C1A85C3|nr:RagB/SusD family nutrient uptake outer membrane protein [Flavobacterium sp. 11]PIF60800.1 putative outer membrane starch-binding protein [Flavobacterium sp. 11]
MKKYLINYKTLVVLCSILVISSCSDEFIDVVPKDSYDAATYYDSDEKVASSTNILYGKAWFELTVKPYFALTDMASGNLVNTSSEFNQFNTLLFQTSDENLLGAWSSCFGVVANANTLILALPNINNPKVSEAAINNSLGEAHFMRALAYFNLVRFFGPVPIVENAADFAANPQINTNLVSDVYKFIENDLIFARDNLKAKVRGGSYQDNARVSSGSAKALLAKVYLYQKKYAEARALAEEVINSGEFKLFGTDVPATNYGDLFLPKYNNNEESIIAFQWMPGLYFYGNSLNTQFASNRNLTEASYAGVVGPSQDLINNAFEPGDLRRKETFMKPGDNYPKLSASANYDGTGAITLGYTMPDLDQDGQTNFAQGSGAAMKKYVCGRSNADITGVYNALSNGFTKQNTYVMRYAELLLIHAEAILGSQSGSTSNGAALTSYNKVRVRAGLVPKTVITFEDIFKERRAELAAENDYWFDLGRLDFAVAKAKLEAQDRGTKIAPTKISSLPITTLIYPYPANELLQNPKLREPAVPYVFK